MSRSNAKNRVFTSLLPCLKVKCRGQGHRSGSRVKVKGQGQLSGAQWSILGARRCRVQQGAIGVITSFQAFVCVFVISGRMRVIARMRSIGF